jgi:hypothetical protein
MRETHRIHFPSEAGYSLAGLLSVRRLKRARRVVEAVLGNFCVCMSSLPIALGRYGWSERLILLHSASYLTYIIVESFY